ncbi:MAG TPA: calcium-binding protein [Nocardioidaceae bacterium]|nr:calcium-binding protein [Nocardioidaceae bacterium]
MHGLAVKRLVYFGATIVLGLSSALSGVAASAAAPVTCGGRVATIVGTDAADDIVGTQGNDVIQAKKGFDTIDGRGGNDLICGDAGADTIAGGAGADRILAGTGSYVGDDEGTGTWFGNKVNGGPGDDSLSGGPDHDIDWPDYGSTPDTVSFPGATGPITVRANGTVTGAGIGTDTLAADFELIVGTPYADQMSTVGARSDLSGLGGNDQLRVQTGLIDITLAGGDGADLLDGSAATKWMVLQGGSGNDVLLGSAGADDANPGLGVDTVDLGNGADSVYGYPALGLSGADSVQTGGGNDTIQVSTDDGGAQIDAGAGQDTLESLSGGGDSRVDATAGTYEVGATVVHFAGIERYRLGGDSTANVTFIGSDAPETLRIAPPQIGDANLLLGGGNDSVQLRFVFAQSVHVAGGPGNDAIEGSWTNDDLIGGAGDDTIDGSRGDADHCEAEHVINCES